MSARSQWLLRVALAVCCIGAGAGCTQNAIFELSLELPGWTPTADEAARHEQRYAFVQVRAGRTPPLDTAWSGSDPLDGFELAQGEARTAAVPISVVGDEGREDEPLRLKVRMCKSARCVALGDDHAPEVRVELARVFYVGHVTSFTYRIEGFPPADMPRTDTFDKCVVRGCVSGDTSNYCHLADGRHFCE